MDYSRLGNKRRRRRQNSQTVRVRNKIGLLMLRVTMAAVLIGMFTAVGAVLGLWLGIIADAPEIHEFDATPMNYASHIICGHTHEILHVLHAGENRTFVAIEYIPDHVRNAFIAIEDERFYYHNGVDVRGIGRAIYRLIMSAGDTTEGASTITQQLIKNRLGRFDSDLTTKLQEQYLAVQFERMLYEQFECQRLVKDHILETYLNIINLGRGTRGVQAAAQWYYGVDVWDLTIAQAATIAAITQNPSRFPPDRFPENNWERAYLVLFKMHELGFITCEEYYEALNSNVYDTIVRNEAGEIRPMMSLFDCFVDATITQVTGDIRDHYGITWEEASHRLHTRGYQIFITQYRPFQDIVDEVMMDDSLFPGFEIEVTFIYTVQNVASQARFNREARETVSNRDAADAFVNSVRQSLGPNEIITEYHIILAEQPQAAFVLMDHHTGHVLAIRGVRGERSTLNRRHCRATRATRSPGSQLKPLIFAAGFDIGVLAPAMTIEDRPWAIQPQGGQRYQPRNHWGGYRGMMSSRTAIYASANVVSVRALVENVGIDTSFAFLQKLGFTTLEGETPGGRVWADRIPALALGGMTEGVILLELAAAYATIANHGYYNRPVFYTHILDHNGYLFLENAHNPVQVMRRDTAYLVTHSMIDTLHATNATGHRQRFQHRSDIQLAGKTGTSQNRHDSGFTGYSPYFTGAVWLGFDMPQPMNFTSQSATRYRETLWRTIMERVHEDLPGRSFEQPPGVVSRDVCRDSGLPPTDLCRSDPRGNRIIRDLFANSAMPQGSCHLHARVTVCNLSGRLPGPLCHPYDISTRVGLMLEPLPDFARGSSISGRQYAFSNAVLEELVCYTCDGIYRSPYEEVDEGPYYPGDDNGYDSQPGDGDTPSDDWPWNPPVGGDDDPYIPPYHPHDPGPQPDPDPGEDVNPPPDPPPEDPYVPVPPFDDYHGDD